MAGELEFGALHRDDRLLDALASRHEIPADDAVAQLLAAFAADVDNTPVQLADAWSAGLLARRVETPVGMESVALDAAERVGAAGAAAEAVAVGSVLTQETASLGSGSAGSGNSGTTVAPPVAFPPPAARRRPRMVLPRAAATAGVAALVLGAGGVAAAVGEGSSLPERIRSVVSKVTEQVAPSRSSADKVASLLDQAETALRGDDHEKAADLLTRAKTQLAGVDGRLAAPLQAQWATLAARVDTLRRDIGSAVPIPGVIESNHGSTSSGKTAGRPAASAVPGATTDGTAPTVTNPLGVSPKDATESPADARGDGITHELPGPDLGNPADNLPGDTHIPGEDKIGEAEADLQDKAKTIPKPLSDEVDTPVGPVHPLRSPSSIDIFDDPTVHQVGVQIAPAAGSAANGVTGGGNP